MADPRTRYFEGLTQGATPAADQGLSVTITTATGVVQPAATGTGSGVIEDFGTGLTGSKVKVVASGPTKGRVSATVKAGELLTADASGGQLEPALSSELAVAICISGGTAGQLVDIEVIPGGKLAP